MGEIKFIYTCVRHSWYTFSSSPFTLEDIEDGHAKTWYKVNSVSGKVYKRRYSGLKDKKGKWIYEGDILNLIEAKRYYTVEYIDYSFKLVHANPNLNRLQWGNISRISENNFTSEVVGNIYEHKHLLV